MPEEPADPPRKFYGLKPREFDSVNAPRPGDDTPPPAEPDPGILAARDDRPITVRALNAAAAGEQPVLGANGPVNRANDVHDILEINRRRARASGAFELKPLPSRRSKRTRDFWLLVILVNVFCVGFTAAVGRFSPIIMLYGFACGCFFAAALAWIMFGVMDDY